MNFIPTSGIVSSAAGVPLSQTKGSETEKSQKDSSASERRVESEKKATESAGIGQTEEDQGASERDADGRRLWEPDQQKENEAEQDSLPPRQAKDPEGNSGNSLDLTG